MSRLGKGCPWHPVGSRQGCYEASYNMPNRAHHTQSTIEPTMSTGAQAEKRWAEALKVSTHPRSEFPQPLLLLLRLPQWRRRFDPWVRKIPWRGAWQPTPVSLPGKSRGQRSLVGYSPRDHKESDTTDATEQACLHVPLVSPPSHHPTKSRKNQKPNRAICHLDAKGLHG